MYIGNLIPGQVRKEHIRRLFDESLSQVYPKYSTPGLQPVVSINMHTGGKYCFVELRDEEMADLALDLNGMELLGCTLNVGKPSGSSKKN